MKAIRIDPNVRQEEAERLWRAGFERFTRNEGHMSNETKHTPGPWKVSGAHKRGYKAEVLVAVHPDPKATEAIVICDILNPTNTLADEQAAQANARLIAAAPELLEALREIMRVDEANGVSMPQAVRQMYRAAIAKACGEGTGR